MVARIGADRGRDAQTRRFRKLLDRIVFLGKGARIRRQPGDEAADAARQQCLRGGPIIGLADADAHAVLGAQRAVEHERHLFLGAHPRKQIVDPARNGQRRVLVRIETPVVVQIAIRRPGQSRRRHTGKCGHGSE
jgi:hypothetical protein